MSVSFLYSFLGSLISILATFVFFVRKYEEDRWRSRIGLYIECINELRDLAVAYWSDPAQDEKEKNAKKVLEVKILCVIEQMSGLFITFESKLCISDKVKIENRFIDLRAACTGGAFQGANFKNDLNVARDIGSICGELYVLVTLGGDRAAKLFKRKYDSTE